MTDATVVSLTVPGGLGYLGVVRMAGSILAEAAGFEEDRIIGVRAAITGLWRLYGDGQDRTVRLRFEQGHRALALSVVECPKGHGSNDAQGSLASSAPAEVQIRWGDHPRGPEPCQPPEAAAQE